MKTTNEERKKEKFNDFCLFGLNQTYERPTDEIVPDPKNWSYQLYVSSIVFYDTVQERLLDSSPFSRLLISP